MAIIINEISAAQTEQILKLEEGHFLDFKIL